MFRRWITFSSTETTEESRTKDGRRDEQIRERRRHSVERVDSKVSLWETAPRELELRPSLSLFLKSIEMGPIDAAFIIRHVVILSQEIRQVDPNMDATVIDF